jgi:hypothetical protein
MLEWPTDGIFWARVLPGGLIYACLSFIFQIRSNAQWHYRRKREYPQPPPPSRNNTRRTINRVDIFYLFSIQEDCRLGTKLNVCKRSSRCWRLP